MLPEVTKKSLQNKISWTLCRLEGLSDTMTAKARIAKPKILVITVTKIFKKIIFQTFCDPFTFVHPYITLFINKWHTVIQFSTESKIMMNKCWENHLEWFAHFPQQTFLHWCQQFNPATRNFLHQLKRILKTYNNWSKVIYLTREIHYQAVNRNKVDYIASQLLQHKVQIFAAYVWFHILIGVLPVKMSFNVKCSLT